MKAPPQPIKHSGNGQLPKGKTISRSGHAALIQQRIHCPEQIKVPRLTAIAMLLALGRHEMLLAISEVAVQPSPS